METVRKSISMTPEMDERIVQLRKKECFSRCSLSEIIRIMIEKGLEQEARENHKTAEDETA